VLMSGVKLPLKAIKNKLRLPIGRCFLWQLPSKMRLLQK
jgi:hypothetical protein